ncbi:hypothetical protein J437_LFUL010451 [Ladona fulva]|uniref:Dendritic cell-specific transmembrane protein-like domain-containing protein n=1 Tax=Ladona fulva TaxID=123851 RepID=A0A8K0P0G1_LADFU|nr:hypothetical protein J437_LFUL010451 [Ladona fulva]
MVDKLKFYFKCFVLLLLPTLFSKRGRQALLGYALVLALAGPARNVLHNAEILSESLACNQEKLKGAAGEAIDIMKRPLKSIQDSLAKVMKAIKNAVDKMKETVLIIVVEMKNMMFKNAFKWLASIANICNRKIGTPSERCIRAFSTAIDDCIVKLGPVFSWLCSIAKLASLVCHILKVLDFICEIIHFGGEKLVEVMKRKLEALKRQLHEAFFVEVSFSHDYKFKTNASTTYTSVIEAITKDVKEKTHTLFSLFSWMGLLATLCFLLVFVKVLHYWHKYLVTSWHLVRKEKLQIAQSTVIILLIAIKLSLFIIADHSLHWLLKMIREYGSIQLLLPAPNMIGVKVEGEGPLATLYQNVANSLQPLGAVPTIDTTPCLPTPMKPDISCHIQIGSLILICLIISITEPYGQRMRHIVMSTYYPKRSRARAVWLYNHILYSRLNFIKFTRRQLRQRFGRGTSRGGEDGQMMENVTIRQRLLAIFPRLHFLFGPPETEKLCLSCGIVGSTAKEDGKMPLIACNTLGCRGMFCLSCFDELRNSCLLCKDTLESDETSDISEEQDSSDDQDMRYDTPKINQNPKVNQESEAETDDSSTDSSPTYGFEDNLPRHALYRQIPYKDDEDRTSQDSVSEEDEIGRRLPSSSVSFENEKSKKESNS